MSFKSLKRPQYFFTTAPLPCPYIPGRLERKVVTELYGAEARVLHDQLSQVGFRRSHNIAYSPVCPGCNACIPVRVAAGEFVPGRTMRRLWRLNADLAVDEVAPRASSEQFDLFARYQRSRHGDGDMATMGFYDYRSMIEDSPIDTRLVEFRDRSRRLVACCLTDYVCDGLSAVYSFFEPEEAGRSLGTFMILWLIERARADRLPYVYLGYWVRESRKMAYKSRFRPIEALAGGAWRRLAADEAGETRPRGRGDPRSPAVGAKAARPSLTPEGMNFEKGDQVDEET
ncbi:MAG: arginyltransferase [Proteobacteria bacterium]|nr:arginyltransferase [Pseudomonadota bacterium]